MGATNVVLEKSIEYALKIMKFCDGFDSTPAGRQVSRRLVRSGTAIGELIVESQGAESTADFIHKMQVAYKETLESDYWLLLTDRGRLKCHANLPEIRSKTKELLRLPGAILRTSKRKRLK